MESIEGLEAYYNEEGLGFIEPGTYLRSEEEEKVKEVHPDSIATEESYLEKRAEEGNIGWFLRLYRAIGDRINERKKLYGIYVPTGEYDIVKAGDVYFNTLPEEVNKLRREHEEIRAEFEDYPFLHPELEEELGEFFEKHTNISELDMEEVCKSILLPRLRNPPGEEVQREVFKKSVLPEYTRFVKEAGLTDRNIRVLTKKGDLQPADEVFMGKEYSPEMTWGDHSDLLGIHYLNPIYSETCEDGEGWRDFFDECGAKWKESDYRRFARNNILNKISNLKERPDSVDEILTLTMLAKQVISDPEGKIWVLTKRNRIRRSDETFFSSEYNPTENWEKNKRYSPIKNFLDPAYLQTGGVEEWRSFFKNSGVREKGTKDHVGGFAERFAKNRLESGGYRSFEEGEKEGFDFKAKNRKGKEVYIEVKGMREEEDKELTEKQSEMADGYEDKYLVCLVPRIPEGPELYIVRNPAEHGEKKKIAIPTHVWKNFPYT